MDKEIRNAIERAAQRARKLLVDDFAAQLEGTFDVFLDGNVAPTAGSHLLPFPRQVYQREKIVATIAHKRAAGMGAGEAVADYLRDAAFTTLNRFVALKMIEARELAQECITKGEQSAGYREFCGMAPGVALLPDSTGYRLYIESLFDELSTEVKVLFNRRDAASILWPKRACFEELLTTLNVPELSSVWGEDETIGWIYQYYNCDDVSEMRKAARGGAPRNSRELAVRNQFFTPRYVVEFLTDNTLGRLWYEMMRGETTLRDRCRYLVRRPAEFFLKPGEAAPESSAGREAKAGENLSQEELLRQPVHIPHRPLKDPREIRLLDPACGSMHFGLYAFDLFSVIYDEAWEIAHGTEDAAKSAETFAPFVTFAASFPNKAAFLREVPRLIVEHNIHGIDIDPRAAQIAGLSLWLRAQRAWHQAGVKPADRLRITHSNIVCAEPMPGEKELLREFVEQQFPAGERPAFVFLLEKIFDSMTIAGEAGSLLRIEEEIRTAIAEAHALAQSQSAPRQARLFPSEDQPAQTEFDLRGLNDEQFWQAAEQRIYDALEAYAEQAENGDGFQRRLFADDAAQGFAFIDLCRKRYDVVVMNPPFGEPSNRILDYLERHFSTWNQNLLCAFLARAWKLLSPGGATGAIFDRTAIVKSTYEPFRRATLIPDARLSVMADLGWEVLDANVEVTTCVLSTAPRGWASVFFDVRTDYKEQKGASLAEAIVTENSGGQSKTATHEFPSRFGRLPNAVIGYDFPEFLRRAFATFDSLETVGFKANQGFALKADKHFRVWWEIGDNKTCVVNRMFNGSSYSPYVTTLLDCAVSGVQPEDLPMDSSTRKSGLGAHRLPGVCFGKRGDYFAAHILPSGHIFTVEGQSIPVRDASRALVLVGYLNTPLVRFALNKYCGQHKYSGYVNLLPFVKPGGLEMGEEALRQVFRLSVTARRFDEVQSYFVSLPNGESVEQIGDEFNRSVATARACADDCEQLFQRDVAARLGLNYLDREEIARFATRQPEPKAAIEDIGSPEAAPSFTARSILSYTLGCVFGRWDTRYATGELPAPELPDPFAPLPVCPPGMLQGDDGLPLSPEAGRRLQTEGRYPLDVAWDGILVDDPKHPLDLERRIHGALAGLWGDRADALEQEACALLDVPTLREWFRRPSGFFADHLKRYSKSRRQAPIYWPLSTASGSYTVWFYYHRFSKDSLYKGLEQVQQKLLYEEGKLARLTSRKELAAQELFLSELRAFYEELSRVTPLWNPNLNDGVIINYGPLWRMIAHKPWQKAVKSYWDELVAGKYDWAHLAMHLWPERVVPKCVTDHSLAIAHGLEEVFWEENKKGKWVARATPTSSIEELVRERSSSAVKAALKNLLDAPVVKASKASTRSRIGR